MIHNARVLNPNENNHKYLVEVNNKKYIVYAHDKKSAYNKAFNLVYNKRR
jgi:hypothetical protein